uniref:Uncharacterized protein n=1 Tax=Caenorhabditis japonica TaxID=281687 RepID=A0A8R1I3S1_CAEJA
MAPTTHSGIYFNNGSKKIKLGKEEINNSIEFPDDFNVGLKGEKKFLKSFTDDVTRFREKISASTEKVYSTATARIATWILQDDLEIQKTSVFAPNEAIGNLRTALVQCNFTDISRLISDLTGKLVERVEENEKEIELEHFVVTEGDSIHTIIDRIAEMTSDFCVLLIRQFESLRPQLLDSLISLIYSNSKIRALIPRLRIVVCVSTSPEFFKQSCSTNSLNLMELKTFEFTKLDEIFAKVISTGIHSKFQPPRPKFKSIEEDDPTLLDSFDCAPGVFSGQFIKYLQNRFFACDYSIDALIRAIQFSLLQKYLKDPLWRTETHDSELKTYDQVLKTYKNEFWESDDISLHTEIQSDPDFWEKTKESSTFRERKQFLLGSSKSTLIDFAQRIRDDIQAIDANFCEKLDELIENLESATSESANSTVSTPARAPGAKISFLEMQKQRKSEMAAKQNNPIRVAKSAIWGHVMSLFESILKPYPATWRNVIGANEWTLSHHVKASLDSNDEEDIEKCLLGDPRYAEQPISIAWRCLLTRGKFKTVGMNEWAAEFLERRAGRTGRNGRTGPSADEPDEPDEPRTKRTDGGRTDERTDRTDENWSEWKPYQL